MSEEEINTNKLSEEKVSEESSQEEEENFESDSENKNLSENEEEESEDEDINALVRKRNIDNEANLEVETNAYFDEEADDSNEEEDQGKTRTRRHRETKKSKSELKQEEEENYKNEARTKANDFLSTLRELCDKDKECIENKQPALFRIQYLTTLDTRLRNTEFATLCLEQGLLKSLNEWLLLEPDLPSYHLRTKMYSIISYLEPTFDQVSDSNIGKTLFKFYNNPKETKDNKKVLKVLIFKWLRTLATNEDSWFRREQRKATKERLREAMLHSSTVDYDELEGHTQAVHAIQAPASIVAFYKNVKSSDTSKQTSLNGDDTDL